MTARHRLALVLALLAVPTVARAHPERPPDDLLIVRPPPPPPPPPPPVIAVDAPPAPPGPPPWRAFGFRMGAERLRPQGHERVAFSYGVGWSRDVVGPVRGYLEYAFLMMASGDTLPDGTTPELRGRAHEVGGGVRVALTQGRWGHDTSGGFLRPRIDLELGGELALAYDDQLGTYTVPQATAGVRLAMAIVRPVDTGGRRHGGVDFYMTWRLTGTPHVPAWAFAFGMDWGG